MNYETQGPSVAHYQTPDTLVAKNTAKGESYKNEEESVNRRGSNNICVAVPVGVAVVPVRSRLESCLGLTGSSNGMNPDNI